MLKPRSRLLQDRSLTLVLAVLAVILLAGFISLSQLARRIQDSGYLTINGYPVTIEIFDTQVTRTQGLSGRQNLPVDHGALFVYDEPGQYGIWMKDMQFAIDVLWLDGAGRVIHLVDDMSPESYPQVFQSLDPASYVLELPSTAITSYGITVDTLVDNLPSPR